MCSFSRLLSVTLILLENSTLCTGLHVVLHGLLLSVSLGLTRLGLAIAGLGLTVAGLGLSVAGLRLSVAGLGLSVARLRLTISGLGLAVTGMLDRGLSVGVLLLRRSLAISLSHLLLLSSISWLTSSGRLSLSATLFAQNVIFLDVSAHFVVSNTLLQLN